MFSLISPTLGEPVLRASHVYGAETPQTYDWVSKMFWGSHVVAARLPRNFKSQTTQRLSTITPSFHIRNPFSYFWIRKLHEIVRLHGREDVRNENACNFFIEEHQGGGATTWKPKCNIIDRSRSWFLLNGITFCLEIELTCRAAGVEGTSNWGAVSEGVFRRWRL